MTVSKTILPLLVALIAAASAAGADAQSLGSESPALRLQLRGPVQLRAENELDLRSLPIGHYELLTHGPSTMTTRNTLVRNEGGIELRPRTGATALLLPPGMVELLHHDRRGWIYLSAGATSTGLWAWLNSTADNAEEAISASRDRGNSAPDAATRLAARLDEQDARAQFTDDNRLRKIWLGYIGGLWLGAALDSWLLTPQATMASTEDDEVRLTLPERSGGHAALRSALIPGAGQRSVGRDGRADFFLGAFLTSTAATLVAQDAFLTARRDVGTAERQLAAAASSEDQDRWRRELENSRNDQDDLSLVRWVLLGTSAYVYVWNIVDAYRVGRPESATGPRFSLTPTPGGARFALSWNLN